jgi:Flp pilus assembly protein TadG
MFKRNQEGQSMVEMALTMPILVLIVAGILDLGRAYFTFVTLSDSAAEGAAYAAIHPTDTAQIIERAADTTNGLVVLDPSMVSVDYAELTPGSSITVTVEYEYQLLTPIVQSFLNDGKLLMRATVAQPIISQ